MSLVARRITEFADRTLSPQALSAHLARIARRERDKLIRSGEASADYATIVDGTPGAAEEQVRPDGVIVYLFNSLGRAVTAALGQAMALSPSKSGDYRRAWMLAVNGSRYEGRIDDIPPNAEVTIVNSLPYHRKLEVVGGRGRSGASRILDRVAQATRREFPVVRVQRTFVNLTPAFQFKSYETPYRLQGKNRRVRVKRSLRSSAFRAGREFTSGDRRLSRGAEMTYPALVLRIER